MNPAIVAPDGFDIIDVSAGAAGLNTDQRRNLGSIAKVLQFASTGKTVRITLSLFHDFFRQRCHLIFVFLSAAKF